MIYDKSYKELKNYLWKFNKTTYGKTIFLICYAPFLICLIIAIIFFIFYLKYMDLGYLITLIVILAICLFSFCIGSYGFYKELRKFVAKSKK